MGQIVAIVGRPNVGKSTLFNRLTGSRHAIVDEFSGVTRDRHYGICEWNGREMTVMDTGGYVPSPRDVYEEEIRKQVLMAMEEADVILFMVDVTSGITDLDQAAASILRKVRKKVIPVVNKVDQHERIYDAQEFHKLGLGEIFCISSINGSGTGDLLDAVLDYLPEEAGEKETSLPRLAIVGRPNVGKSTLLNTLLGETRNIVTPEAGTTRDAIRARYRKYGHDLYLIDTAGLRKKSKVARDIEFYSVLRSVRAIEDSDVCLLMIDAAWGMESQDMHIFGLILRRKKGVVILVNKWDLVEKTDKTMLEYERILKHRISPFTNVPVIYMSATRKQRIHKLLDTAVQVYRNRERRIPTSHLNRTMLKAIGEKPPPMVRGKQIRIKYVTQLKSISPVFVFFCNHPESIKTPYKRYLENRLREQYDFSGVPVSIFFRKK